MSGQTLRAAPLDQSEPVERAGLDELRALQLIRLTQALSRAALVPQYRQKFVEAGIAPGDLKHLDDLKAFPFTTKEDLRQNYPFGMFAVPMHEIVRIHASSGTTGQPTVVGYTRGDIESWSALMARSIRAAGGRPGDKMHVAYGYGLFTGGLGFHYGAEHLGCAVIPVSGGFTERQVQLITDFKAGPDRRDTVLSARNRRRIRSARHRCAAIVASHRAVRRRAVDRAHAQRNRAADESQRAQHLRSIRSHRSGCGAGIWRRQRRSDDLGGSLLSGDHRSRQWRGPARRRGGRISADLALQRSHAGHSLSHPRSDQAIAWQRARHA